MDFSWSVIWDAMPALLAGARLTIYITVVGLLGGLVLGAVAGLFRAFGPAILNAIAFAYVELIRGTPIVV
ncbi:MAG TPA: ABC transporter permease subunit, partial [Paracoccaceae bacterium]|nr:ABC transporter permease subunit [Paracoccaceae bacterium]